MALKQLYLAALAVTVACASGGSTGQGTATRRSSLLTALEMETAHADVNTAYDAVARLRPNWLAPRGPVSSAAGEYPTVFVDGQPYGDVASLKNIPAYHVGVIEYFDVTQAGARFGIRGGGAGAIEVRMKRP
jgi:hypothetical protein